MPEVAADIFLAFSELPVILLIIIAGYILIERQLFFRAACLAAITIIVNTALKGVFQIPLALSVGKIGYAFPSGHMQFAVTLYVWLACNYRSWALKIITVILLSGIAFGLMLYGYHNIYDVLGGIFSGVLLVYLYSYANIKLGRNLSWVLFLMVSGVMIFNFFIYTPIPQHTLAAYFILLLLLSLCPRNRKVGLDSGQKDNLHT